MSFRMSGEFCSGEAVRGRFSRRRGQTLVASLIVIAIIMILTVVYMRGTGGGKPAKPDGRGTTTMGAAKVSKCPVGKETYTIDPESGEIHCPHLGHEKF